MMYTVYGFESQGLSSQEIALEAHGGGGCEESEARPVFFYTPCLPFDQAYWSARGVGQLCLFSSPLPVGQAVAKANRLAKEWQAFRGFCREKGSFELTSEYKTVYKDIKAGARDPAFFIASLAEVEREAAFLFPLLNGRALWLEEIATAVASQSPPALGQKGYFGEGQIGKHKLIVVLQHLYLTGKLEITSGVKNLAESGLVESGLNEHSRAGQRGSGLFNRILTHFTRKKERFFCHRCGAEGQEEFCITFCASCNRDCAYCTRCITMGRSRMCSPLYLFGQKEGFRANGIAVGAAANVVVVKDVAAEDVIAEDVVTEDATEKGAAQQSKMGAEMSLTPLQIKLQLTPRQAYASQKAIDLLVQQHASNSDSAELLIWAVCGAGKTEVIYPVVNEALLRKQQVLITTPRKDVVLELGPRVAQAFPLHRIVVLHGSSKNKWENGDITIATTHQLLRFYHRFDLVILDEVDAYPFHNNPMLYRAVHRSVAKRDGELERSGQSGKIIYLSATPPAALVRRLDRHTERVVKIPARYHGYPLPVPKLLLLDSQSLNLNDRLTGGAARSGSGRRLLRLDPFFQRVLGESRQAFVFVPYIEQVEKVRAYISIHYPELAPFSAGVHSRDLERESKVMRFRQGTIRLLVTTTVLERGVTVPGTDVMVWNSDSTQFDEASLVQIAGRAGRSANDPDGWVWFVAARRTNAQVAAIRHIREMNRLAGRLGLLNGSAIDRSGEGEKMG